MGFGIGKLPGANNTHKRKIAKLAKQGYTPQEISDQLRVILSAVLSFYQKAVNASDEDMAKFPLVDTSIASNREAMATADAIIADAKKKAAEITAPTPVAEIEAPAEVVETISPDGQVVTEVAAPVKKKAAKKA